MSNQFANILTAPTVQALTDAAADIREKLHQSPDGKMTVSVSLKLQAAPAGIACKVVASYGRKSTSEAEDFMKLQDPNQPELLEGEKTP